MVVGVDGEIDGLTAPRLRAELLHARRDSGLRLLLVDVGNVQFLASVGLRALGDALHERTGRIRRCA